MKILKVNGMRCGHCKAAVEEAAAKIPGVSNPVVDLDAKELRRSMRPPCAKPSSTSVSIPNDPRDHPLLSGRPCGPFFVPASGAGCSHRK